MTFAVGFLLGFFIACALWFVWAIGYRQGPAVRDGWPDLPEDLFDVPEHQPRYMRKELLAPDWREHKSIVPEERTPYG